VAAWRTERWWKIAGRRRRLDGWWLGRGAFGFRGACRESAALVWGVGGLIRCGVLIVSPSVLSACWRSTDEPRAARSDSFPSATVCLRSCLAREWRAM
jgi:hypothetical protein